MRTKVGPELAIIWLILSASQSVLAQGGRAAAEWDLKSEVSRAAVVAQLRGESVAARDTAWQLAAREGWSPKGGGPGFQFELQAIRNGRAYFYHTMNVNAAISTAANLIRNTAPYSVNGTGRTVGLWDGGWVRTTHQELTGRVTIKDTGATTIDHATHVAGTIGASGVVASALGMAPSSQIASYDWNTDTSEMTSRAMVAAGQSGRIQLSNHSYGYLTGWDTSDGTYKWYGVWGDLEDSAFGQYDSVAYDWDTLCYSAPYYLPCKAAGNDRSDVAPPSGTTFSYWSGRRWKTALYDPATGPFSDGYDNGGFDTIDAAGTAKNILTVGAVYDAVSGGSRSLPAAAMLPFSCWGPADDGRVKPDVVGNGYFLHSSIGSGDASYASYSGTSMATPNVCGSASLLTDYYGRVFPGQYMRASALKGLIIHTADDLGNAGPDYKFGWGLVNVKAAADVIKLHYEEPAAQHLFDSSLSAATTSRTNAFTWTGTNAIRATLCWTDPAGSAQTALDSTTKALVNDLDLRVIGPQGQVYLPYVLVPSTPAAAATTGDNTIDTVEQVYIASPGTSGTYRVTVTLHGSLSGSSQAYSLILSGSGVLTYTVTFDAQGGTAPSPASKSVTYGGAYGTLAATTRAGYAFGGWWTGAGGTGAEVTDATAVTITAAQTLYAKWTAESYEVAFDAQGGTAPVPASKSVTYSGAYGTLAATMRAGYAFGGWWTGAGGTGAEVTDATAVTVTAAQTLYAKWTAESYEVTFDAQGGAVTPVSKIITFDSHYGTLPTPSRAGYSFTGWWIGANGMGIQVAEIATVTAASNHTLYAFWTGVINASAGPGGSIVPAGIVPIPYAGSTNILIQPLPNHHIADVLVNGLSVGPVSEYTFVNVTSNQAIHASFAINEYSLTVISAHGGDVPGTITTGYGSDVSQWVTNSPVVYASTRYVCNGAVVFGNSYEQTSPTNAAMTLTNNATLAWNWTTNYLLSVLASGGGTVSGGGWYNAGSDAALTAVPNEHYRFTVWSDGDTSSSRTVVIPEGGASYTATFAPIPRGVIRLQKSVYSVAEDAVAVVLKAERVDGSYGMASVTFTVAGGSATADEDYSVSQSTFSWTNGETGAKSILIQMVDDNVYEGNETFTVSLFDATGAALGEPAEALVTIVDSEGAPSSVLRLCGNLDFGEVATNVVAARVVEVWNDGNQTLSVTNISVPSGFSVTQQVFTVQAGEAVALSVWFAPMELAGYGGLLELGCNATSGTVALAISGTGVIPVPPAGLRTITGLTAVIAVDVPEDANVLGLEDQLSQGLIPVWISEGGTWDAVNRKVKWFFDKSGDVRDRALQYTVGGTGSVVTGLVNFGTGNRTVTGDTVFGAVGDPGLLHPADDNGDWRVVLDEVSASVIRWKNGLDEIKTPVVIRGITLYIQGEWYTYDPEEKAEAKRWIPMINTKALGIGVLAFKDGLLSEPLTGALRSVQTTNVTVIVTPATGTSAWGMEESVPEGVSVTTISNDGKWDANHSRIKWVFYDGTARSLSYSVTGVAGTNVTVFGMASFDGSEDPVKGDSVVSVLQPSSTSTTPVPVPYAWLDQYPILLSLVGGDCEAAALADADGDGYTAWQEYVAGSVPTNRESALRSLISVSNGEQEVSWTPDLGTARVYTVEGRPNLAEGAWGATNAGSRFFRVNVWMP